jgi:large subunit ribosomal protein L15
MKGQKARSGGGVRPGFEGGQNPLIKGLPKLRGFNNIFRKEYQVVNLDHLSRLPEAIMEVTPKVLADHGFIRTPKKPVKVLGGVGFSRKLQFVGLRCSQAARTKIEEAGGELKEATE